tara:strand:- start:71 stop:247 length:177 start_codon:yes stop_codon:yes gene_type:complete
MFFCCCKKSKDDIIDPYMDSSQHPQSVKDHENKQSPMTTQEHYELIRKSCLPIDDDNI